MADVVIYTASYGGCDAVPRGQKQQDIDVEWRWITDAPPDTEGTPWRVEVVAPHVEHRKLAAKHHKTHPPLSADGPQVAIWIDANMEVTSKRFAREAIAAVHDGLAAWGHPRRDCIYDEAEASLGAESQQGRYAHLPIREQVAAYRAEGFPEHAGLLACGAIVWTPPALDVGRAWYDECARWSYQDQLSLPVVCWRAGVSPGEFPVPQIETRTSRRKPFPANRWLRIWPREGARA